MRWLPKLHFKVVPLSHFEKWCVAFGILNIFALSILSVGLTNTITQNQRHHQLIQTNINQVKLQNQLLFEKTNELSTQTRLDNFAQQHDLSLNNDNVKILPKKP